MKYITETETKIITTIYITPDNLTYTKCKHDTKFFSKNTK